MAAYPGEKITEDLDGVRARLAEYARKFVHDHCDQKPRLFGKNPGAAWGSDAPLPSSPSKPPESDPTKADPHDLDTEEKYSPDMPGGEQGDQRG